MTNIQNIVFYKKLNTNYNYITVLSNWLSGYDKYSKTYSKKNLNKSTFPNQFFLLLDNELSIGLNKANNLLKKININNNSIIRIQTLLPHADKNTKNGLGWTIDQNWINVHKLYILQNDEWIEISIEDLTSKAYLLQHESLLPYNQLIPRSLSILPVAKACQANCKFCFSESSISFDQKNNIVDLINLEQICKIASSKGCQRFVITGGGEPTLINFEHLLNIIKLAKRYFNKIILISNGLFLSEKDPQIITQKLNLLIDSGLSVLALSYHHYNSLINNNIMGKNINTDYLLNIINQFQFHKRLTIRLICVLQKEGISNQNDIQQYIDFAIQKNVTQICFKELYVSSSNESIYSQQKENIYSQQNQIPLKTLINYLHTNSSISNTLPWGSPVFNYKNIIDIAAYTEPSVGWERSNGIARSWNILSDGKCFASLEDKNSILEF